MRIFNLVFFQEKIVKKETLADLLYREMVISCESTKKKAEYGMRLPKIPLSKDLTRTKAVEYFKVHLKWKQLKKCHWYGDKKYCFHTGKPILYE